MDTEGGSRGVRVVESEEAELIEGATVLLFWLRMMV